MAVTQAVCGSALWTLLHRAAAESARETEGYCIAQVSGTGLPRSDSARYEESLAWIAARITQQGWNLLSDPEAEAMAPIAWAVQEMMEWASHLRRYELLGDLECRTPITWLPNGTDHPLGTSDMAIAAEQRLQLLRQELRDYGVIVEIERARGVA